MSHGRQRFSIIPAGAVTDARLEPRALQVLCLLGRHTDNNGWCRRSQVKMALELSCGRATVQRALSRLVEAGYLEHRPQVRDSGGDTAHDYRVVIDPPTTSTQRETAPASESEGGAHIWAGVPTGGQGCPPMDGQGVPTHGRAPRLTTPVKRNERERERDEEEFERARRAWPTGFADSREDALAAWRALTSEDRRNALAEIERFVSTTRAAGRKFFGTLGAYLSDRKWTALPKRPTPSANRTEQVARSAAMPRSAPTAFQRANPHLYPELFGNNASIEP